MTKVNLADKAVLANLTISRWGGHAYDSTVTAEVTRMKDASNDAGRWNKKLLPPGALAKINGVVNAARDYHRAHTQPWLDDGVRILPSTLYMEYASAMKKSRDEFDAAVKEFLSEYPKLIDQSKKRLGKMFNASDYPAPKEIESWYGWQLTILPFPDSNDFRVDVPELTQIKKDMQARMDEVYNAAMKDIGDRVVEVVGRMSERLKGYKPGKPGKRAEGTFKDSLVDNVSELAKLLPAFNMGNDPKLTKLIAKISKDLTQHNADTLREDDKVRKQVAKSADEVLTAIADFIA